MCAPALQHPRQGVASVPTTSGRPDVRPAVCLPCSTQAVAWHMGHAGGSPDDRAVAALAAPELSPCLCGRVVEQRRRDARPCAAPEWAKRPTSGLSVCTLPATRQRLPHVQRRCDARRAVVTPAADPDELGHRAEPSCEGRVAGRSRCHRLVVLHVPPRSPITWSTPHAGSFKPALAQRLRRRR